MISPITGKEMIVKKEWRKINYRKESFDVLFHTWHCVDSGENFEDENFSNINYEQVVNQYRERYNIPFPEDIKAIREQYNLPAIRMSQVLGLGENSYRQYEAGEMPSLANARLIQMAADPHKFLELLILSGLLDDKHFTTAISNAKKLIYKEDCLEDSFFKLLKSNKRRSRYTGYSIPNFKKLREMVLFFVSDKGCWKTKLNKLLFYADFSHYKLFNRSISGGQYCPIDMGPVPDNFNTLFETFVNEGVLDVNYQTFPDGGVGEKYIPLRNFDKSLFTEDEIETLKKVKKRLKDVSTQDVIKLSHQEKAWTEANENKTDPIDYTFAYDLTLF